jgi:DHA2 family multidrug resistance protein
LILAPLSGIASDKFAARNLAVGGFAFFAAAFYYSSTHVTLSMSFGFGSWLRMLQVAAIPVCFIAITNAAYMGLPKEASNQVSGIINFARNVGGSIFISITGALVTNRSLFHQNRLADHMQAETQSLRNGWPRSPRRMAVVREGTRWRVGRFIVSSIGKLRPWDMRTSIACFAWMALGMILCAFLLSKNKPGEGAPAGAE